MDGVMQPPKERLYIVCVSALLQSARSVSKAVDPVVNELKGDGELVLALLKERYTDKEITTLLAHLVQPHLQYIVDRDMSGGPIGTTEEEIGSDAAAEGPGQARNANHATVARPSAPISPTSPATATGGGHVKFAPHSKSASPSSRLKPGFNPVIAGRKDKPAPAYNPPAVPPAIVAKVSKDLAVLSSIKCDGQPAVMMTAAAALSWCEKTRQMETEKISASKRRIVETQVVNIFASGLPPTVTLGEFYEEHPEEYRKRMHSAEEMMQNA